MTHALTVESGAGVADANSYAHLDEADAYHRTHGNTDWTGVIAEQTLTLVSNPLDGDTFTIGSKVYTMQTTLTDVDGNIAIGSTLLVTQINITHAVNFSNNLSGLEYADSMTEHPDVSMTHFSANAAVVQAKQPGTAPNGIDTTETFTDNSNTFGSANLQGGVQPSVDPLAKEQGLICATTYLDQMYSDCWRGYAATTTQRLDWPRSNAYDNNDQLWDADAIPEELHDACAYLARQHANGDTLLPDEDADTGALEMEKVKVGPIEVQSKWAGAQTELKRYRTVDRLIYELTDGHELERS